MISFNRIGQMGRFANQMFQYASMKGIATNRGFDFCVPYSFGNNEYIDHKLFDAFDLKNVKVDFGNGPDFHERMFNFDADLFMNCPEDVNLNGFFQTEKYFKHIRDEILEDFTFKNPVNFNESGYISVHVRRGDYVHSQTHHPLCDLEYYKKAMEYFPDAKFLVSSDDLDWCKAQELFKDCLFAEGFNNIEDLEIMSRADHNIIANSSFSWWGAWLNNNSNKKVICPSTWFGPSLSHHNTSDIRPEEWIQI